MSISPEMISEPANLPTAVTPNRAMWYAIQTRGRHEKTVAKRLREQGFEEFLPLISETHRWSDRRMTVEMPLYPCYTFLHASADAAIHAAVLRIPGIVNFVGSAGRPHAIPDQEIEVIQRLLAQCVAFKPHVFLSEGTRVRIRGGALEGVEGILLSGNSDSTLIISVQLIQRSLALQVDGYDVEPV